MKRGTSNAPTADLAGIRDTKRAFGWSVRLRCRPLQPFSDSFSRCVLLGSCPQLLNMTLRAPQNPVDQKSVGVSTDLGRDPGSQSSERGGQSLAQPKDPLEARKSDLYVSSHSAPPLRSLGGQQDADLGQSLPQMIAAVGQRSPKSLLATPSPKAASLMSSSVKEMSAMLAGVSS